MSERMEIGVTGLKQVCMVVKDLKAAEKKWNTILGMQAEHLTTPLWEEVPSYTDGKPDTFHEEFILYHLKNDVILEIFGPGKTPGNPWGRYLEEHGEGVMNLAFYVESDREKAYKQIGEATGVDRPYHEGFYPSCTYSFVGTQSALGIELNIKCEEDNRARIEAYKEDPKTY